METMRILSSKYITGMSLNIVRASKVPVKRKKQFSVIWLMRQYFFVFLREKDCDVDININLEFSFPRED